MTRGPQPEALCELVAMKYLQTLAVKVPDGQAIVELGVYQGASLAYLARGAGENVPVFGIDPWGMHGAYPNRPHMIKRYSDNGQKIAQRHLEAQKVAHKVELIKGLSVPVGRKWSKTHKIPVGLLFIDAVHREKEVLEDFYAWKPHLAEGAIVAFDDHDERFDGVRRAVKTLVDGRELVWKTIKGSRLAVLQRPTTEG